jgi:hypothetical protein
VDEIDDQEAVARYIKVNERTVENWRYQDKGPRFMKQGRVVRYRRSDVDRWVDNNIVKTGESEPAPRLVRRAKAATGRRRSP